MNVIPLRLPALRERGDDILHLACFFVDMYVRDYGLHSLELAPEALDWLKNYEWPGNVRELQNLMERATLLAGKGPIQVAHFLLDPDSWPVFAQVEELDDQAAVEGHGQSESNPVASPFSGSVIPLHEMERIMILKGLEQTSGNRTMAADLLGISVRTLRNKLNEYRSVGLEIP